MKLCPWSGAECCECCPRTFPFKENGELRMSCAAWRARNRYDVFARLNAPANPGATK